MNLLKIIYMFLLTVSLVHAQSDLEKFSKNVESMVEKCMIDNTGELLVSLYADDAISFPSYEPMVKGIDAMKKKAEMDKQMPFRMLSFDLVPMNLVETGDYGFETGTYSMSMEMQGMPSPYEDQGKYINIYQKIDGEWKIKYDMWNSDLNPWATMPGGDSEEKENEGEM